MRGAPVSSIGHGTVSPEQREWRRYKREMLYNLRVVPGYYDCDSSQELTRKIKRLTPERFSTNYKTEDEFNADRCKIGDYIFNNQYAPEELVNKVLQTIEELDIQYGDI